MSKKNSKNTKPTKNTKTKNTVSNAAVCVKDSSCCNLTSRSKFNKIVGFVSSPLSIPLWILAIVILLRLTK